jgi:hypothetical protein
LAALLVATFAALVQGWLTQLPAQIFNPQSAKDRIRSGPDFSVTADIVLLDDEGASMVTRSDYRPTGPDLRLISRPGAGVSPKFSRLMRSAGGISADDLTVRITLTGHRNQKINILDIHPQIVQRGAPWSGTYFSVPHQGGSSTMNLMFDMDRPQPVARDVEFEGGEVPVPGRPFFSQRTITLRDNEQQVVLVRFVTDHHHVAFKVGFTYMLGHQKKKTVIDDHGRPFQVTASLDPYAKRMPYRRFFEGQGDLSFCQVEKDRITREEGACSHADE